MTKAPEPEREPRKEREADRLRRIQSPRPVPRRLVQSSDAPGLIARALLGDQVIKP